MLGFVNVNKPTGVSSAFVVSKVKKLFNTPCGHMGTLDPMASGVLPIALGKTSRLFQYLLDKTKTYIAEFTFGYLTDTLDATGNTLEDGGSIPTAEEITKALPNFVGEIEQVPPKYSAKCVDGKRGYELARKGVEFTLAPKKVTVYSFQLLSENGNGAFTFLIECGGGTYIRSLCRDLGTKLGTVATMTKLTRSKCGIFDLDSAVSMEDLTDKNKVIDKIIPSDYAVNFPKISLTERQETRIINGVFDDLGLKDGVYRVYGKNGFLGVGSAKNGVLKIDSYVR